MDDDGGDGDIRDDGYGSDGPVDINRDLVDDVEDEGDEERAENEENRGEDLTFSRDERRDPRVVAPKDRVSGGTRLTKFERPRLISSRAEFIANGGEVHSDVFAYMARPRGDGGYLDDKLLINPLQLEPGWIEKAMTDPLEIAEAELEYTFRRSREDPNFRGYFPLLVVREVDGRIEKFNVLEIKPPYPYY
jgi:hypothetical protein